MSYFRIVEYVCFEAVWHASWEVFLFFYWVSEFPISRFNAENGKWLFQWFTFTSILQGKSVGRFRVLFLSLYHFLNWVNEERASKISAAQEGLNLLWMPHWALVSGSLAVNGTNRQLLTFCLCYHLSALLASCEPEKSRNAVVIVTAASVFTSFSSLLQDPTFVNNIKSFAKGPQNNIKRAIFCFFL